MMNNIGNEHSDLAAGKSAIENDPRNSGANVKFDRALGRKKEHSLGYLVIISMIVCPIVAFITNNHLYWLIPIVIIVLWGVLKLRALSAENKQREMDIVALERAKSGHSPSNPVIKR